MPNASEKNGSLETGQDAQSGCAESAQSAEEKLLSKTEGRKAAAAGRSGARAGRPAAAKADQAVSSLEKALKLAGQASRRAVACSHLVQADPSDERSLKLTINAAQRCAAAARAVQGDPSASEAERAAARKDAAAAVAASKAARAAAAGGIGETSELSPEKKREALARLQGRDDSQAEGPGGGDGAPQDGQSSGEDGDITLPILGTKVQTPPAVLDTSRHCLRACADRVGHFFRPKGLALRLLTLCVLVPGVIVFLYLSLFASNIYLTEAKFSLRSQNQQQSLDLLSAFMQPNTSTTYDAYILQKYIESMDVITKVDAKLGVRAHYEDRSNDVWYRLEKDATQDEMLDYWSWAVTATYDPDTSIMTVEVKAFSPEMAQQICQTILDFSEELVNAMNERARTDAISLAMMEVQRAETRIKNAQQAMLEYREREGVLDLQAEAQGQYQVVYSLKNQLAQAESELAAATGYLDQKSPRVVQLKNAIEGLKKQIASENSRISSQESSLKTMSAIASEYENLKLEQEFAQRQLTSAMTSLETARVTAESKTIYLESFQKPIVPDESLYPRPFLFTLVFMVTAAVLLGLVSLIIAAVREHAGF